MARSASLRLAPRKAPAPRGVAFSSFKALSAGVPAPVVRQLIGDSLRAEDVRMIIPDRTLERRIAEGENLRLEEADGISRLLRVVSMAREVFGDAALADEWLRAVNPALGEETPIRMARTDIGGREVEAALGRLAHGVFG